MYRCPKCGSSDYLIVDLSVEDALVDSDGHLVEILGKTSFDGSSRMFCGECKYSAHASDFERRNTKNDAPQHDS